MSFRAHYAVQVTDEAGYADYRAAMTPILAEYGGAFTLDVRVSDVLRGPTPFNRLFTIRFPSEEVKERFFADERYLAVRARLFVTSVSAVHALDREE